MVVEQPSLKGTSVTLEPLSVRHAGDLLAAIGPEDDLWAWMPAAPATHAEMVAWVEARITPPPPRQAFAFLQQDPISGAAMGSTSLFDIDLAAESAEIGHTWIAAPHRRSRVNTEAKFLLLQHAFESMGLRRVQFMTDARIARSQAALARIGATREGLLRNFRRDKTGALRDSVVFGIVEREWPAVKAHLALMLAR